MNTAERVFADFRAMNHRRASLLLLVLVCIDLVFIALHVTNRLASIPILSVDFDLAKDRGFPEFFNYIKYFTSGILVLFIRDVTRANGYIAWMIVFLYFLVDDAAKIHETTGRILAMKMDFHPPFNMRLQDFGELIVSAAVGSALLAVVAIAYWRSSDIFRKVSNDLLLLVLALAFFGIFTDMVNSALSIGGNVAGALGVMEDGGEMIASSLILWYVFLVALRRGKPQVFLHDLLRGHGTKA